MKTAVLPDGTRVSFPDDVTPDEMDQIVNENHAPAASRNGNPFDEAFGGGIPLPLDETTGAPAGVRAVVGAARSPEDRLATIRRFYPDAQPHEGENFVFTDPATGKPTLYNPPGIDAGDLPSLLPEASEIVGGTVGGVAGLPAGPAGVAIGTGAGAAAARSLFDTATTLIGPKVDTRSLPQVASDVATTFDLNAGAQGLAHGAGVLASRGVTALKGVDKAAAMRLRDLTETGITPRPALVSRAPLVQQVAKGVEYIPSGAGPAIAAREQAVNELQTAANDLASRYGQIMTKEGAGDVVRSGAREAASRIQGRQEDIYDQAFARIGANTPTPLPNVAALTHDVQTALSQAPESMSPALQGTLERAQALLRDAGDRGIPFDTVRRLRTNLREDLNDPVLLGATGSQRKALDSLYGALTRDMRTAAENVGAGQELALADRYTRFHMNQTAPTLEKIASIEEPGKVYNWALSGSRDDALRLARIRRSLQPEEWDNFAGTVLGRMGVAKAGMQDATGETFSPATFLTNWNNLTPEAKNALFGGSRYAELRPSLDRLARVADEVKRADRLGNPSGTARGLSVQALLAALGGVWAGDVKTAAAVVGGSFVAPNVAARLITNPRFARWLASAPEVAQASGGAKALLTRLVAVGKVEPAIRNEIGQYVNALAGANAEDPARRN